MNHTFDEYIDMSGIDNASLKHYGVKGQRWYGHQFGNWERHARYARGKPNPDTINGKQSKESDTKYGWGGYNLGLMLGSGTYLAGLTAYKKLFKKQRQERFDRKILGPKHKLVSKEAAENFDRKIKEVGFDKLKDTDTVSFEDAKKAMSIYEESLREAVKSVYNADEAEKYLKDRNIYGGMDPMTGIGFLAGIGAGGIITALSNASNNKAWNQRIYGPDYKKVRKEKDKILDTMRRQYAETNGVHLKDLKSKDLSKDIKEDLAYMELYAQSLAKQKVYGDDAPKYGGVLDVAGTGYMIGAIAGAGLGAAMAISKMRKENTNSKSDISDVKNYGLYGDASSLKDVGIKKGIYGSLVNLYGQAKDLLSKDVKETNLNIDPDTGFKLKQSAMSETEDMKAVNPMFLTNRPDYTRNCMYCTSAYEMRRRGYDVQANKIDCQGFDTSAVNRWFPNAKNVPIANIDKVLEGHPIKKFNYYFNFKNPVIAPTLKALKNQGDGARGMLFVMFDKGAWGGHCISYDVNNGKVTLRDPQSNETFTNPEDFLQYCYDVRATRLDGVEFDKKGIKEAVH